MATMMQELMDGVMANPDVAVVGVAAGFVLGYFICKRKNRNPFGGGGMI